MIRECWVRGLFLSFLILFIFAPLGWAQDFCGEGQMTAILNIVPPCYDTMCYGEHFGDVTIVLTDCATGDTLGTIEQAFHHLPPCSLGTPCPGDSFPLGGVDTLQGTMGQIILSLITPPVTESLFVMGDMRIMRSDPDSLRYIDTEIISMELNGMSPTLGPISVRAGSDFGLQPSLGIIQAAGFTDYPAFSTFDVIFEITPQTGVEEKEESRRSESPFILHQATPNPLTTRATIRFGLKEPGNVSLKVYNLRGERVRTLMEGYHKAGLHKGVWDLKDEERREVSSGVYFYRLTFQGVSETRKIVLVR